MAISIAPYLIIFGIEGFQSMGLQVEWERSTMWEYYGGEDKDEPKQRDLFDHFVRLMFIPLPSERERERSYFVVYLSYHIYGDEKDI